MAVIWQRFVLAVAIPGSVLALMPGRQGFILLLKLLCGSILAEAGGINLKCKPIDRLLLLLQQGA
jgi:hypothetical protein